MDIRRKHHYYKYIVKRHLNDIKAHIGQSKNEMEKSYYRTHYAAQLSVYAKALGVQERILERFIQK
ncbi:MAG: hypothetical protein K2P54_02810 [Odoribacter sp.]|nr:hypothetical protein [Odoribacter sp.]